MMRNGVRRALVVLLLAGGLAGTASAQRTEGPPSERRAQLERRFQQELGQMLQQRLELSDAQLQRLTATNARFEQRRRTIVMQELETRRALRQQIQRGDAADQQRISTLVDRSFALQRQRLDLIEEEQRELAMFLSPRQRAMFLAMQEQVRHRAEEVRRQRGGEGRPAPRRQPPGARVNPPR